MPIHDWTRVEAGIFHAFHTTWVGAIQNALNEGLLPKGYYALAEQHAGSYITDVLALHASPPPIEPEPPLPPDTGGIALAEAPPRVRRKEVLEPVDLERRRTLAIRHVSGHRLVALLEIISPSNRDRAEHVEEFAEKVVSAVERHVHVLLVDLFPPGSHNPEGFHAEIVRRLRPHQEPCELPSEEPLTLASYAAGTRVEVEHLAVGDPLPEMPEQPA